MHDCPVVRDLGTAGLGDAGAAAGGVAFFLLLQLVYLESSRVLPPKSLVALPETSGRGYSPCERAQGEIRVLGN